MSIISYMNIIYVCLLIYFNNSLMEYFSIDLKINSTHTASGSGFFPYKPIDQ